MTGQLGCPRGYRVELVFVQTRDGSGNALPAPVQWSQGVLQGVTRVQWGRRLNGVSAATVTVGGPQGYGVCCDQIEQIQPSMFDIRLWRDSELVWAGSINDDVETSLNQPYVIHAEDALTWLDGDDGRPNLHDINYDDEDVTYIAQRVLVRNLTDQWAVPPDYPMILDDVYIEPVGDDVDYKPRLSIVPVIQMLDDLTDLGLVYTMMAGQLYLVKGADTDTPVMAQLTQEDFSSPMQVTQDGTEMGNVGVAVRPGAGQDDPPDLFFAGNPNSAYRPHYRVVDVDAEVKDATAVRAAKQAIKGRGTPPVMVTLSGNGALRSSAPIQINEMIPGWTRVDYMTTGRGSQGICTPLRQPAQFGSVDVDWVPGREQVKATLLPVGSPTEVAP